MVQESRFLGSEKTLLHLPDSVVERIVSHLPEGRDRHAASCVCASFARVVTAVKRRELQKLSVSHFVVQHPDTVIQMLRESQQLVSPRTPRSAANSERHKQFAASFDVHAREELLLSAAEAHRAERVRKVAEQWYVGDEQQQQQQQQQQQLKNPSSSTGAASGAASSSSSSSSSAANASSAAAANGNGNSNGSNNNNNHANIHAAAAAAAAAAAQQDAERRAGMFGTVRPNNTKPKAPSGGTGSKSSSSGFTLRWVKKG